MSISERPDWTDSVLQGLAYWIGYKKQYYRFYPLSEGAIVGETLSLLASNLDNNMRLEAEVMYKKMCEGWEGNGRADIVISTKNGKEFDYKNDVHTIIEIKREESAKAKIVEDYERLAKFIQLSESKTVRCFMILVSQGKLPSEYVSKNGNAKHADIKILGNKACVAKVRRVCKATSKFDKHNGNDIVRAAEHAHYACLIEVLKKEDIC